MSADDVPGGSGGPEGGADSAADDALLAELGAALAELDVVNADPTAERRRAAARAAFTWRSVDAELAELLHDSALDAGAAVRSAEVSAPRALSFGRSGLALEIEVDDDEVLVEVVVEVVSEGAAAVAGARAMVTILRPDGREVVGIVDAAGFARFTGVAPGTVRFIAERAGYSLVTPWVTL